ncbi:MAG: PSD1 domain-containing protein [Verrucomicrobiae bacterium]|nr:PSD1 domain-containing protein [Verrucomicrobiae bacterium]
MIAGDRNLLSRGGVLLGVAWLLYSFPAYAGDLPVPAAKFHFDRDIRPVLETTCVSCHGPRKQKGGLRLDTADFLREGGDSGPAYLAGNSAKSDLILRIARLDDDDAMPPKEDHALTSEQVATFRTWIDAGAPWPEGFVIRDTAPVEISAADLEKLPPAAKGTIDFVRDVQPIFAGACYNCHGPKHQEANFRLDHKPTLFAGGELGPAVEKGDSARSPLVHFVAGLRPEGRMPKKGDPLSNEQIGILRAWIDQGAEFPDEASVEIGDNRDHWSFVPPVKAPLPQVGEAHPIDAFIKSRLDEEGLAFSPEADRRTLLRRLHLDLTGLPPTLEEQDAFLNDPSPDAWKKLVDRLLASPHYGERWGRHWLDAARYADSDGYEKDKPRIAHFYRDWVIDAHNRDLPWDQFIIEQIAGDLLPNATQDQVVATGYLRNSMLNEEGGVDPEQFRMEAMFDRMDAIGKGILALGLNCVQCHNHKYDPITQEEYYRIFAFLNNDHEAQPRVYTPDEHMRKGEILRGIAEIEARLRETTPDWETKLAAWEDEWRATPKPEWTVVRPEVDKNATGGQRILPQPDGSFIAAGFQPTKSNTVLQLKSGGKGVTGFRLEMLNDPNLPAEGPGRSFMGTFGLSEFQVETKGADGKSTKVKFAKATADLAPPEKTPAHTKFNEKEPKERYLGPASYAIDGNHDTGWSSDLGPGRRNLESVAVFATAKPLDTDALTFQLVQRIGGWNADDLQAAQMGHFRLSVTTSPDPEADPVPVRVREALAVPREKRSPYQVATIFSHWRTIAGLRHPELAERYANANAEIEALWAQHPEGVTQFTLQARDEPRLTSVLKRGDWLTPTDNVTPGVPEILNDLPADAGDDRLTFAKWLVAPDSPTTARAVVNRVWQAYFGTGIVATAEDFGTQGEDPSHPELLDWLAVDFMEKGWSLKHLHQLIVTSKTYRQSSLVTPELRERDPQNRLLARGPRFRVEGEIIRDIQLSVSGLLNPEVGGPAVMPPAPAFLFEPPASYAPFPWEEATGKDRYRRAVYTWRRRTTPYPFLQTFDTPEGNVACIRRTRANTPIQALVALNETVSMEAARAFAGRVLTEGGKTDAERLDYAWRLTLARSPEESEAATLTELMDRQRERVAKGKLNAQDVAATKSGNADLAAWILAARVLLNLDETFTKE